MINVAFNLLQPFLWTSAGVCLYALMIRRLADLVYPLRMKLARLGEETIALGVSDDDAKAITLMLDNAFSPFASIVMVLITPVAGMITIPRFVFAALGKGQLPPVPPHLMKISEFFVISVCAANPIFGFLLMLEMLLFFIISMFFLGPTALTRMFLSLANSETKFLSSFSDFKWSGRSSQA